MMNVFFRCSDFVFDQMARMIPKIVDFFTLCLLIFVMVMICEYFQMRINIVHPQ